MILLIDYQVDCISWVNCTLMVGTVDACRAAEPLIQEALVIDEQTNNVLGYATRVGLLCKIMVILNKFAEGKHRNPY